MTVLFARTDAQESIFSEEQIIGLLQEHERGAKFTELCREHGIIETMFHQWKRKYGGMQVSDARRLKALEDENRRLKQIVDEQALDNRLLKKLLGKPL